MIIFGAFTIMHLLAILFFHFLPGLCGAAVFIFKGYGQARPTSGSLVRGIIAVMCLVCGGVGGLFVALCLPEWPEQ